MVTTTQTRHRFGAAVTALLAALALVLGVAPLTDNASAGPPGPPERGKSAQALAERADREGALRLVVELDASRNGRGVAGEARRNGASQIRVFDVLPYVALRGGGQAIRALERNPHVVAIHEDVPQPPSLASTLPVINADDTQALGWTGAGTTVAILDTGIDADHPFFNDNDANPGTTRLVSQACYSTPSNNTDEFSLCPGEVTASTAAGSADIDGNARCAAVASRCDHGTHVAGIAAGDGRGALPGAPGNGVAPDADIVAIQVFTRFDDSTDCNPRPAPCTLSYPSDQIAGLNQVAALDGANPGWNIVAANMSLGGGSNSTACDGDPVKPAIDALLAAGIATTIAAGNNSFQNAVGAPGCISTAVTVGNSTDADAVSGSSNRGPLLDIFAPGTNVDSAEVDDTWGSKTGTSMAAPHVAGAFAVLREAYPTRTIGDLLNDMTSTGVPITYSTGGTSTATTPRLDLLAALQAPNDAPGVGADEATVTVDEGSIASTTGTVSDPDGDPITSMTASTGTVTRTGGTWSWTWQTSDGPADSQNVTITATDDKGEQGSMTFDLDVRNVAPTVTMDPAQITTLDEGTTVTLTATFTDPGSLDTHTAAIDWGVPLGQEGELVSGPVLTVNDVGGPGSPRRGTVTGTYRYGDNDAGSGFPVTVSVTDKDGGNGSDAVAVSVRNIAPTTALDLGDTVVLNGVPTVVAHAGDGVGFESGATDPGSDDLSLGFDFGDGTSSTGQSQVNPPTNDATPSPTVQPRDATFAATHAFGDACLYQTTFTAADDDGASTSEAVNVVITGNADLARSSGYWSSEYRGKKHSDFTAATLACYLGIVDHVSGVFSEIRPLSSSSDAAAILKTSGSSSADELLDAQLLAAWLNFANGAYDLGELVDADGDGVAETAFVDVVLDAESLRTEPTRTRSDVLEAKAVLEGLNNP
jgi:subtilisin family serine protease